jgi:hypothetical protein
MAAWRRGRYPAGGGCSGHTGGTLGLIEDGGMLLEEPLKHRPHGDDDHRDHRRLCRGALQEAGRRLPQHPARPSLEGERPDVEVPSSRAERA